MGVRQAKRGHPRRGNPCLASTWPWPAGVLGVDSQQRLARAAGAPGHRAPRDKVLSRALTATAEGARGRFRLAALAGP
eukprot:5193567-Alexandrium_andersonii.AAC.1